MPALPSVASVIEVVLQHSAGQDLHLDSRIFFRFTGTTPTVTMLTNFATDVASQWGNYLAPLAPVGTDLIGVTATDLSAPAAARGSYIGTANGARSGTALPDNCATVINYQIARRYRGGKPRSYLPFGVTADMSGRSNWTSGYIGTATGAWTNFHGALNGYSNGGTTIGLQCNVSYYSGFTVVTNPITHRSRNVPTVRLVPEVDDITLWSVNPVIGSQRRRLRAV